VIPLPLKSIRISSLEMEEEYILLASFIYLYINSSKSSGLCSKDGISIFTANSLLYSSIESKVVAIIFTPFSLSINSFLFNTV
jgi:hypothetical protein